MLSLVWQQLDLFPHQKESAPSSRFEQLGLSGTKHPGSRSPESVYEIDGRTGLEWNRRATEYCEWRSGRAGRRLADPAVRWHQDRIDYLDAVRLLESVRYSESIHVAETVLEPPPSAELLKLRQQPRGMLINELLSIDPKITNRKLVSRFRTEKLADMVLSRRIANRQSRKRSVA